ncbi:MAG: type II toxin-antitoxin system RelE/ParE family toxin [Zoogloeaceae bacterium]|jgi:plasmid stabilization system protein ParE|nr:type II toxin-antitoxin system RelE/ParE family toxin [Zoogloeaceae bacterium]
MLEEITPYRIVWRPFAESALNRIVDFIAQDSPVTAAAFGQKLREKTLLLIQNPGQGRSGRPGLPSFVREWVIHRRYIVFYRVRDDSRTVEILNVRHTSRQLR